MATQTACKIYQFPTSRMSAVAPRRGFELTARIGLSAKGVVYLTAGALAVEVAFGRPLLFAPLLWLMVVGLGCYVVWRFVQALLDSERVGRDGDGIMKRIGFGASGVVHAALAAVAARLALAGLGSEPAQTARLLFATPLGPWLVGSAGVALVAVAAADLRAASSGSFMRSYERGLTLEELTVARRIGRVGLSARAATFVVVGWALARAALGAPATHGFDAASGDGRLVLVAAGLAAYGLFALSQASHRRWRRRPTV